MQIKFLTKLILTMSIIYPTLCAEQFEKSISVHHDPRFTKVEILDTANLRVTPLLMKPMKVVAFENEGINFLSVELIEIMNQTPALTSFGQSPLIPFVGRSPTGLKIHADITNVDPLVSTRCYHDIHNAGYVHAANQHTYIDSTLGLAANGCLKLNPASALNQRLQLGLQQGPQQDNSLGTLMSMVALFATNHSSRASTLHQGSVKPECSIASLMVRPYMGIQREVSITGSIVYGQTFSMALTTQGAVLEFQPNQHFRFIS